MSPQSKQPLSEYFFFIFSSFAGTKKQHENVQCLHDKLVPQNSITNWPQIHRTKVLKTKCQTECQVGDLIWKLRIIGSTWTSTMPDPMHCFTPSVGNRNSHRTHSFHVYYYGRETRVAADRLDRKSDCFHQNLIRKKERKERYSNRLKEYNQFKQDNNQEKN